MFIKELSCVEVLLNHLINGTDLNREIFTDFSSTKTFSAKKNNLFNYISINKLIANYCEKAPFQIDRFVSSGIINGLYDKPTTTPMLDPSDQYNPENFIANLVEALREDNYIFDEGGSVFVSSEKVEVSLPQAWLYRLAEGFKRKQFSKLFLYNKNEEADITDRMSLIDYLRHTKTFLVSLDSATKEDYEVEFAKAEALTNREVKKDIPVRVEDLIRIFKSNISEGYNVRIDRYKLSDLMFIVKKADQAGRDFYTKKLEEQKKDLNNWLLEYINSNRRANEAAQEYLLLGDKNIGESNKKDIIIGLINLYFGLLKNQGIDFNEVSLTDFKIDTYLPLSIQESLETNKKLIQSINSLRESKAQLKIEIDKYSQTLGKLEFDNPELKNIKAILSTLVEKYQLAEQEETSKKEEYNALQASIREREKDSLLDISFANDKIIELIIAATQNGRVFIAGDNIIFELYNTELGKTSFKAIINTKDFLTLVENINYTIREKYRSIKN